jgi:GDP-L-fucose synthase
MYGPWDSPDPNKAHALNALVAKFVRAKALNESEVAIWGTGAAVREWLYAPDFSRIVLGVVQNPGMMGLSEPTNIGQNFGLSVRELVNLIVRMTDYRGAVAYDYTMPDGAPRKVMDDTRFRKIFPDFVFTHMESGIREAIAYYESLIPY